MTRYKLWQKAIYLQLIPQSAASDFVARFIGLFVLFTKMVFMPKLPKQTETSVKTGVCWCAYKVKSTIFLFPVDFFSVCRLTWPCLIVVKMAEEAGSQ